MTKHLSEKQINSYNRNGFVGPVKIFSNLEVVSERRKFEVYEENNEGWYELSKGQKLYLLQTWVASLVSNAKILDAVEDILGEDIMCWGTSLFVKEPGAKAYVSWHQDSTYWGLSSLNVVTAWIALSPASIEAGCMKFLPGSHRWDQSPHHDTLNPDNLLTRGQEILRDIAEEDAVLLPLKPGEMSLHNIRTIHSSGPNKSSDRRIGIAIRYLTPQVRQLNAEGDSAWLVRGSDRFGYFHHESPPAKDMDPAALKQHARIMELRQGVLYRNDKDKLLRHKN
ncbi:MAG: hypothetical protein CFH06_01530 [Alphaproteobacteria bacterium MarineAlpha3_Bin5]|nr:phytanoyl-CoA dioxygenase [Magnetovibrio sp.]PPR76982.1 MAG: hypothetical protein CFH06_01530 [Alphaproteobacteria bacterium MarineAlpha3_Bin5]